MPHRAPRLLIPSVRGRLALLVFAVAAPAALLVVMLTKRGYDSERAAVGHHLMATVRAVAVLVERKFDAAEALLRGFESLPSLEIDDIPEFERRIRATITNPEEWIVLTLPDGQQVMNTRLSAGAALPRVELEPEFWTTLRRGERYVANVIYGPVAKGPVLSVSLPIVRRGELKYALTVAMLPSALARATALQEITQNEIVAVIDRNATLAARSKSPELYVGRKATPVMQAAMASQSEGIIESKTFEGIPTLSAFSRCPTIGWTAAIGAPQEELFASARAVLRLAGSWSAALVVVATVIAIWIGHALVRGIETLVADTERVGSGEVPAEQFTGLRETDLVGAALRQTAQRLAVREKELTVLNATLEQRVATRTQELAAANAALTSANRELVDFARVASHDLREPLRSIRGFAEVLREDYGHTLDPTARKHLDRVCAGASRLHGLLEAILTYSKVSTAPLAPFETVDLAAAIAEVQQDVARRLNDTGGRIETGPLPSVRGDRQQLHQLLLNLIGNALKFHRPNVPPVVRVAATTQAGWVHLAISDNGTGFDQAHAERIFAPFERLDHKYEGTGVGLSIVRRVAERHGGSVRASSARGTGSRFEVILPAATAATAEPANPAAGALNSIT